MADVDKQYLIRFGPNANCTFDLCSIEESVYSYRPSLPANIIFAIIFGLAAVIHIFLAIKWKTWWFMWCMILACTHEIAGYGGRVALYVNPWDFAAFIVQIICITQAPVFYCAAIYVMLARLIDHYCPTLARFPPKYLVWIFLPCDIISLVCQGVGGSLSASSSGGSQAGVDIALAGLILQVVTLVIFSGLLGDFMFRFLGTNLAERIQFRDKAFFACLILALLCTLTRCVFRAEELKDGYSGESIKREDLFIGLEGVLVVASVAFLFVAHPGFIFNQERAAYGPMRAASDEGVALAGHKVEAKWQMQQEDRE